MLLGLRALLCNEHSNPATSNDTVGRRYHRAVKNWDLLLLLVVPLVAYVELELATRWNRTYFTVGLPLFVRRVERPGGLAHLDLVALHERTRSVARAQIIYQRLDAQTVALLELLRGGRPYYGMLMRGVIRNEPGEPHVRVVGLLNAFPIALVACFGTLLGRAAGQTLLIFAAAYAIVYAIQAVRFSRVAKALVA